MRILLSELTHTLKKEFKTHAVFYGLLSFVIVVAFTLRIYRQNELLGFYYDQGRDALVIWRFWHEGRLFLVGPVTGLAGIYLGPLYYYLIAPFYILSGGNPVVPVNFLAFLATVAIMVLYILGVKLHSRTAGFIAVVISSFSLYIVQAGRWLSNPTPILLTSVILFWVMWEILQQSMLKSKLKSVNNLWILLAFLVGISLQFESASAVFYFPVVIVFYFWLYLSNNRKSLPDTKTIIIAVGLFVITLLPQIAFNFRHDNLILDSFKRVLVKEKSFRLSFWDVLVPRLNYLWEVFNSKIIPERRVFVGIMSFLGLFSIIASKDSKLQKKVIPLFAIFLFVPCVGYILFQGNFGNIFDYYMTGYYLPMLLLFSIGLAEFMKSKSSRMVVLIFFLVFFTVNIKLLKASLLSPTDSSTNISLPNQLKAVDYILKDGQKYGRFNVDFYVPPVVPYAYDYLFLWQGNKLCGPDLCGLQLNEQALILYTPYELDLFHPYRLESWLNKQEKIGNVVEETKFGGIVVQRRVRI
jgi:4-amino-4-deoxy-L-arabinose transferase-like glycosyltransferase